MLGSQVTAHAAVVTERSGKNIESEIGWGHEYVITSLLENAVSWKINEAASHRGGSPQPTLIHGHALCLCGRRPSSAVHHFGHINVIIMRSYIFVTRF